MPRVSGHEDENLRDVLKPIASDPCFGEQMSFDVARDCFTVTSRFLRRSIVIDIIRTKAIQCHVWTPGVIPILEFTTQFDQMIKTFDDGYAFEPFIFQGLDRSFCDRNRSVFSYGAQTMFDVVSLE